MVFSDTKTLFTAYYHQLDHDHWERDPDLSMGHFSLVVRSWKIFTYNKYVSHIDLGLPSTC